MLVQLLAFLGSLTEGRFAIHLGVFAISAYLLRFWANGAKTDRERDMHGRVVLLTVRPFLLPILVKQSQPLFKGYIDSRRC